KWTPDIRWSYNENFTVSEFVGCFRELHRESLRKFPVTSANVIEALPKFALQMRETFEPEIDAEPVEEFPEIIDEELPEITLSDSEREDWKQMMHFFKCNVNEITFDSLFKFLNFEGVDEENKLVKVSARQMTKDWLTKNYDLVLEKALMHQGFIGFRFQWRVY
ncbi:MAG TPA: hypothetical protein PKY82_20555, partial [Pyrinomonadaceae bacterium]|nr:hypothetical protein [Pyrinomonadaceae bacterium]